MRMLRYIWLVVFFSGVVARAEDAAASSSLLALDQALVRFGVMIGRDRDPDHRASSQIALDELKKRRDALHAAFDQGKYDELRVDLNLEYQRQASWVGATRDSAKA